MKERLFKNYVTTILGVLILGVAIYLWATEARPMEEVALVAGYAFMFLRSKDSLIGIAAKK